MKNKQSDDQQGEYYLNWLEFTKHLEHVPCHMSEH